METLQLGAGKYQLKEPLTKGPLETFSATVDPGGKAVYVHRVHLLDPAAVQLESLLAAARACSDHVCRRVIETAEQDGYWYAVTLAEQRCLLLREWLDLEVARAGSQTELKPAAPVSARNTLPEPGEFTRIFLNRQRSQPPAAPADNAPGEITTRFDKEETPRPETFRPVRPEPSKAEPGDFTDHFGGRAAPFKPPEQRHPAQVQRPNTPVPPRYGSDASSFPGRTASSDNFPREAETTMLRESPDLSKPPAPTHSMFHAEAQAPVLPPSEAAKQGEYTRLFGNGALTPPSQPEAMGHTPLPPLMPDSPRVIRNAPSSHDSSVARPVDSPSVASSSMAAAPAPAAAKSSFNLPINANLSPMNPLGQMNKPSAHMGLQGGSVQTPLGSANISAPPLQVPPMQMGAPPAGAMSPQTKMIVFFSILAILAVVLVVFLVATQKP